MNTNGFRPCSLLTALLLALTPALAQQAQSPDVSGAAAVAPAAKTFSQQELDQLMAPIALYPDALLAQILMASPLCRRCCRPGEGAHWRCAG